MLMLVEALVIVVTVVVIVRLMRRKDGWRKVGSMWRGSWMLRKRAKEFRKAFESGGMKLAKYLNMPITTKEGYVILPTMNEDADGCTVVIRNLSGTFSRVDKCSIGRCTEKVCSWRDELRRRKIRFVQEMQRDLILPAINGYKVGAMVPVIRQPFFEDTAMRAMEVRMPTIPIFKSNKEVK